MSQPESPSPNTILNNIPNSDFVFVSAEPQVPEPLVASEPTALPHEHSFEIINSLEVDASVDEPFVAVTHSMVSKPAKKKPSSKKRKAPAKNTADTTATCRQQHAEARTTAIQSIVEAADGLPSTMICPKAAPASRALYSQAHDVWYFVRPVDSYDEVPPSEIPSEVNRDAWYQASLDFNTLRHPQSSHIQCIPCLKAGRLKIWANNDGGVTKGLRSHMEKYHITSYYAKCYREGLVQRCSDINLPDGTQPEFTRAGFLDRFVDWVVTDDQAMNVVESEELRELILYCGQGAIRDTDIPHRDKLPTAAWAMYLLEKSKIDEEMKNAHGRICLTSDLWSDGNLRSFMAVTAHYIDQYGNLRDHLISFRKINGSHTGTNIAQAFVDVLDESNVLKKVGFITLDNASNNNTLMEELAKALVNRGVDFDPEENHIRCFPHVLNLAVNTIIKSLSELAAAFRAEMTQANIQIDTATENYLQALESSPVDACRASVAACRSSGLHREGLRQMIINGNQLRLFRLPGGSVYLVPEHQLLRNEPTRWSLTYNMVTRYLEQYPAVVEYAFEVREDVQIPVLSHKQFEVLQDIVTVLRVAHNAQELLSAEKTLTLSLAFPVYEAVVEAWEQLCIAVPELSHAVTCGISKIQGYVSRTQSAPVHPLAMAINPVFKLDWIRQHWSPSEAARAEGIVKAEMLKFQHLRCLSSTHITRASTSSHHTAQAQNHGFLRVLTAGLNLQRASSLRSEASTSRNLLNNPSGSTRLPNTSQSSNVAFDEAAFDQAAVEEEFGRYMSSGTFSIERSNNADLVDFWKNHQFTYPLLFRIAMDVLPVQASSVSSERVFLSSKLTCTAERNRITPENMEYLQVLKHALRWCHDSADGLSSDSLDFVTQWYQNICLEDD
ncbi:hypothetical protein FS749_013461 [Ceratobasidium sp. UAMH 11750]|nr:hypothetical protein FS749_013461 [Ceratobasidium sp. UAMH 11750]